MGRRNTIPPPAQSPERWLLWQDRNSYNINGTFMKRSILLLLLALITFKTFANSERWDDIKTYWSPLMLAIYKGQTNNYIQLIRQNVDLNFVSSGKKSNWHLTALDVAIRSANELAAKELLSTNKIIKPETYLMTACGQESGVIINLLIKYGANPNDTLENGYSVSMMAASFGSLEVLKCLIKNGADINQARKSDGMTTLMFAAFNGDIKKVKLILEYKANKYAKDNEGKIALNYVDQIYPYKKVDDNTKSELRRILK